MATMSHLRSSPRPNLPTAPTCLYRVGLLTVRVLLGVPFLALWMPYLGLSYLLQRAPFPTYNFWTHSIGKSRWLLELTDDFPPPETPEVAFGIRQLPFCNVYLERVAPLGDEMRKGIGICPEVESVTRAGYWLVPKDMPKEMQKGEKIMMQIHGGGFRMGHPVGLGDKRIPPSTHGVENGMRLFSINQRKCLDPSSAFPAPLLDSLAGYLHLTRTHHVPPEDILITAKSSGAYIAIMFSQYLHLLDLPQPARYMLMSPPTDLTFGLGKWDHHLWDHNGAYDIISAKGLLPARDAAMQWWTDDFIAGPWVSPAIAPSSQWKYLKEEGTEVYVYYGTGETMTRQIEMWISALREAGVKVIEEIIVDGTHVAVQTSKEAIKQVLESQRKWIQPWKNEA